MPRSPAKKKKQEAPAEEVLIPVEYDAIGRRKIVYTTEERRRQEATVETLLLQCASTATVVRICGQQHGIGPKRSAKLMAVVRERWAREEEANRATNRATAIRRYMQAIQRALAGVPKMEAQADGRQLQVGWLTPPNMHVALRYERLLTEVQGTRAPLRVEVNVDARVTGALSAVIASLTPEQMAERLARVREREEKARRYDLALGPPASPNPGLDS